MNQENFLHMAPGPRIKFAHIADVHLARGFQQFYHKPHLRERRELDFARAFSEALEMATLEGCDFVVIAGDLFHKGLIRPVVMENALAAVRSFDGSILAVGGNHDHDPVYGDVSVLSLFAALVNKEEGWTKVHVPGETWPKFHYFFGKGKSIEVYYMHWRGKDSASHFKYMCDLVSQQPLKPRLFVGHFGVEGYSYPSLEDVPRDLIYRAQPYFSYMAMGHIHSPFEMGNLVMPGSLNKCTMAEEDDGLMYIVTIDEEGHTTWKKHFVGGRTFLEIHDGEDLDYLVDIIDDLVSPPVVKVLSDNQIFEREVISEIGDKVFDLEFVRVSEVDDEALSSVKEPDEVLAAYFDSPVGRGAKVLKEGLEKGTNDNLIIKWVHEEVS